MKMTHSFNDFEAVKKAFFDFAKTLVENSKSDSDHTSQDELKKEVNSFCNNCGVGIILEVNKRFTEFQKAKEPRYTIELEIEDDTEPRVLKVDTFQSIMLAVTNFVKQNAGKRYSVMVYDEKEEKIISNLK